MSLPQRSSRRRRGLRLAGAAGAQCRAEPNGAAAARSAVQMPLGGTITSVSGNLRRQTSPAWPARSARTGPTAGRAEHARAEAGRPRAPAPEGRRPPARRWPVTPRFYRLTRPGRSGRPGRPGWTERHIWRRWSQAHGVPSATVSAHSPARSAGPERRDRCGCRRRGAGRGSHARGQRGWPRTSRSAMSAACAEFSAWRRPRKAPRNSSTEDARLPVRSARSLNCNGEEVLHPM